MLHSVGLVPGDEDVFAIAGNAWVGTIATFLVFGEPFLFGGLAIFIEDENADVVTFTSVSRSEDDAEFPIGKSE